MRAFAEFIMRGRAQATLVAVLGSFLPLVSPAAVALVSLRRGSLDGSILALWAILPPVLLGIAGYVVSLEVALYLVSVAVALIAAQVLRRTIRWNAAMLAVVLASAVGAQLVGVLAEDWVSAFLDSLHAAWQQMEMEVQLEQSVFVVMLGYVIAVNGLLALLLARWWQSLLYNPGGFRQEILSSRMPRSLTALLTVVVLLSLNQGGALAALAGMFALPLLLNGCTLVHCLIERYGLGVQVLVLFYILTVLLLPLSPLLIIAAGLLDSWLDFRGKLLAQAPQRRDDQ